jgi:hypothetical protein
MSKKPFYVKLVEDVEAFVADKHTAPQTACG